MTKIETIETEQLVKETSGSLETVSEGGAGSIRGEVAEMISRVQGINVFRCELLYGLDLIADLVDSERIDWQQVDQRVEKINQGFNEYLDSFSEAAVLTQVGGEKLYRLSKLAHDAKNLLSVMFCSIDNILEGGGRLDKGSFVRSLKSLREMAEGYLDDSESSETFEVLDFWDYLRPWLGYLQMRFSGQILIDVDSSVLKMSSQNCFAVTRVIDNLMGNSVDAIEKCEEKLKKKIQLKIYIKEGNMVLMVADNGPGIPKELVKTFWRMGVSSKRENGGSGMGMGIVIDNVKDLGGRIEFKSFREEDGRGFTGTVFRVTIPMENLVG